MIPRIRFHVDGPKLSYRGSLTIGKCRSWLDYHPPFVLSWGPLNRKTQPDLWFRFLGRGLSVSRKVQHERYMDMLEFKFPVFGLIIGYVPLRGVKVRKYVKSAPP